MTAREFRSCLDALNLTQVEAAKLLSVSDRSIRRWAEAQTEVPGPVEQVLHAWMRLDNLGLAWRPDSEILGCEDSDEIAQQIALYRKHSMDLDALIASVNARGGPAAPWQVHLNERRAILGPIEIRFYPLRNGGFSPASYTRKDGPPDQERDWRLIEDGFACVANAIRLAGKGWASKSR